MDSPDGRTLTLEQAAERLGISREAARKRAERGSFPGAVKELTLGWIIPADALDRPPASRPDARPSRSSGMRDADVLSELRAIRALLERVAELPAIGPVAPQDAPDGRAPGRPSSWWRWLLFGEVRAR